LVRYSASHFAAVGFNLVTVQRKRLLKNYSTSTLRVFQHRHVLFRRFYSNMEGFMGRFVSGTSLIITILGCFFLAACGSSSSTRVVTNEVPATVSLTVSSSASSNVSLSVGKTVTFTATARNNQNALLTETFSFQSSNPSVLTIAGNGTACAGTWDSLTNPQICTPGPTGTSQVTATAEGVSSPAITVYVHQLITSVTIAKVPTQPATLSTACLSKGAPSGAESWQFEAFAFNGTTDITTSVGPFTWQDLNPGPANIVNLTAPAVGSPLNQEIATANTPGISQIFASASGINSQAISVQTCPVQTISLQAAGNPATSFVVNSGTLTTVNATVTDILGLTITGAPLTWISSNPLSVGVSGSTSTTFGGVATVSSPTSGSANVIASCTPPACNGGIKPSEPIYPPNPLSFTVRSTTAPASPTVYATTTGCASANPTNGACTATLVPITKGTSTSEFAAGGPIVLPSSPNSVIYDETATNLYLGVESSDFSQHGLMTFNGTSVSQATSAPGKVLAVSPDGLFAVVSDTVDVPNLVSICQNCASTASSVASFQITGATAAAFSPDSLKAFIVAGSNLYVYSKVDALQKVPLNAPASDVDFLGNGMFGYLAGGDPAGGAFLPTCFDLALPSVHPLSIPGPQPQRIRSLPNGNEVLVLAPPDVETITASVSGNPSPNVSGCPAPRGFLTAANTVGPAFNLGVGNFTPAQLIVSGDGSTAYILADDLTGARLPFIIVFNINAQTSSSISLANNSTPLSATVSPAGDLLFVGASDGTVHVIDTASGSDLQQVTFPFPTNELCFGPGSPPTQVPATTVTITAATQSGSNTTYAYTPTSGLGLQAGQTINVIGMTDTSDNGTFVIAIANPGSGTFTVVNASGAAVSGQNGVGTVPITCNPDLVVAKP
jgi:hypothetical protein